MKTFKIYYENAERVNQIKELQAMIKDPDPRMVAMYDDGEYVQMLKDKATKLILKGREDNEEDAQDRCKRKADSVYGKKTSAYKSGAIVRCRKGKIWKKK